MSQHLDSDNIKIGFHKNHQKVHQFTFFLARWQSLRLYLLRETVLGHFKQAICEQSTSLQHIVDVRNDREWRLSELLRKYFVFSVETQHTIGYGGRQTTEECPEAIFIMSVQANVTIQAKNTFQPILGMINIFVVIQFSSSPRLLLFFRVVLVFLSRPFHLSYKSQMI